MIDPRAIVDEQAEDPNLWRRFGGEQAPVTLHEELLQAALRRLHEAVEGSDLRPAVTQAIAELDAEHYADPSLTRGLPGRARGGCVMCWPKDGSWPCVSRQVADDLRAALGEGE